MSFFLLAIIGLGGVMLLIKALPLLLMALPLLHRVRFILLYGLRAYSVWRHYRQPPMGGSTALSRQQAAEILGLKEPFTPEDVETAYRRLSKRVHPDVGGSDYFMRLVAEARQCLREDDRP